MKHPFIIAFLLANSLSLVACNSVLRALPGPSIDTPRVAPELDERVRNLDVPPEKAILYVYQSGNLKSLKYSDVYVGDQYLGRIFPGTYLFAIIDPPDTTLKSEVQLRYADRYQSYPVAYHNSWGSLDIEPGQRYFVQLVDELNESHTADQYSEGISKYYNLTAAVTNFAPSAFNDTELSALNNFNVDDGKFEKPPYDTCPFGVAFERRENTYGDPIPCSFTKSF